MEHGLPMHGACFAHEVVQIIKVILSRLAFLADCPFSPPTNMFLPTSALVHFIQQAREIKTRPQNCCQAW
jgi:hypothetical protein